MAMAMAICKPSHCVFSNVAAPSSTGWRSHPAQHIVSRLQSQNGSSCRVSWTRPSTSRRATIWRPFAGTVHGAQNQKKLFKGIKAEAGSESHELPQSGGNKSYLPKADFYKIEAVLRPWRLPHVASALIKMGIRGVTVSDVRGFGAQGGSRERQAGSEFSEDNFVTKVKMEVVVSEEQVEVVIDTVIEQARTGEIGDGKIFVLPISDIIRVRTGQIAPLLVDGRYKPHWSSPEATACSLRERGTKAERMVGGRSDLLSSMAPSNGSGY